MCYAQTHYIITVFIKIIITIYQDENITSITGYKFGQITVQNTITNPSPEQSYSLDEQLTGGTWIDGKPIYRKTISCGALPNTTSKTVAHGITNIDWIVDIYGTAATDSGSFILLPHNDYVAQFDVSLNCNANSISIVTTQNQSVFTKSYITLEYTKTTDV